MKFPSVIIACVVLTFFISCTKHKPAEKFIINVKTDSLNILLEKCTELSGNGKAQGPNTMQVVGVNFREILSISLDRKPFIIRNFSPKYNCFKLIMNWTGKKENAMEVLLQQLKRELGFEIHSEPYLNNIFIAKQLKVQGANLKLTSITSTGIKHSFSNDTLKIYNASIPEMLEYLKSKTGIESQDDTSNPGHYDFIIPTGSNNAIINTLKSQYGIDLRETSVPSQRYVITN